jgi:hypothetical protein
MDTVQRTPVTWLWWPYIAIGKLAMLDGDPGIGKTLLMAQLAASLSRGQHLPDQEGVPTLATGGPHVTVMLSTEDGLADTLKPRLDEAGADSRQVKVLQGWKDAEDAVHAFTFADMPILERTLQEYQPRLVIIDPIQAYLGSSVDMNSANETRPLLEALRRLAEQYQCAIVCIRHLAKAHQGGKAMHRGLGSVDFIGAARTGLVVEQHPTDPGKVLLAQSKSNIGPLGRTQVFTKYDGQFEWCTVSRITAEMLAGGGRGPDPHAFVEAICWLEDRLADGIPVASEALCAEADEEGISAPTLRRAKKALKVRSVKNGEHWDWQLVDLRTIPQPSPFISLATEPLEHVQADQGGRMTPPQEEGPLVLAEEVALPGSCGCGQAHPAGGCPPQPVENREDAQEAHDVQEADDRRQQPRQVVDAPYCPRCRVKTTWTLRGGIRFCYKCHTPDLRAP